MNIENLQKAVDYLKTLPDDYNKFDMERYGNIECGTAGCVCGHIPLMGFNYDDEEYIAERYQNNTINFQYLSCDLFDLHESHDLWDWMFSGEWADIDNTIQGAIKRMEYVINNETIPIHNLYPDRADDEFKNYYNEWIKTQ